MMLPESYNKMELRGNMEVLYCVRFRVNFKQRSLKNMLKSNILFCVGHATIRKVLIVFRLGTHFLWIHHICHYLSKRQLFHFEEELTTQPIHNENGYSFWHAW